MLVVNESFHKFARYCELTRGDSDEGLWCHAYDYFCEKERYDENKHTFLCNKKNCPRLKKRK